MEVLIYKEKHGDRIFLVKDRQQLLRSAMKIFRDNDKQGGYYVDKPPKDPGPEPEKPTGPLWVIAAYDVELRNWKRLKSEYERDLNRFELYEEAKGFDLESAYGLLQINSINEYEDFQIVDVEDV